MESDSISSTSSDDAIMLLNSAIIIAGRSIESASSDSTDLEKKWGGSPKGKSRNIPWDFEGAYNMMVHHYFIGDESLYNKTSFEQRFGIPRSIINRLWEACDGVEPLLKKTDRATKRLGISPFVRFISAISQIKYGGCAEKLDEHLQLSETVANEALEGFCRVVVSEF